MKLKYVFAETLNGEHYIRFRFDNQWVRCIAIRQDTTANELGQMMIELGQKIIEDREIVLMRTPNES